MFLHCTYIFLNACIIAAIIKFMRYMYNYSVNPPLNLTTTKPVHNLTRTRIPPQ